ncbi:MAG: histidine triad nucleotide-binding protein [Paenibacillaceae bacterium]
MLLVADCIFCKIIRGELPSTKVFENEFVVAFRDIVPLAKIHIVIIPKKHIPTLNDFQAEDWHYITEIHQAAQQIARDLGTAERGFRLVNNCNADGGQVVYHLHYHLLGGEKLALLSVNSEGV